MVNVQLAVREDWEREGAVKREGADEEGIWVQTAKARGWWAWIGRAQS